MSSSVVFGYISHFSLPLAEFHSLQPTGGGGGGGGGDATYTFFSLGSLFAAEVTLPLRPDHPFGSRTRAFPSKKAAKSHAAKEAVLWLRDQGHFTLTPDGTLVASASKQAKKAKGKDAIVVEESGNGGGGGGGGGSASFAAQVASLATRLGMQAPTYRFVPSAQAPSIYSGAAYFEEQCGARSVGGADEQLDGPIGEVRNVFGKKNAKEECAKKVLEVLKEIAAKRVEGIETLRAKIKAEGDSRVGQS